jgi:hypothetical protein
MRTPPLPITPFEQAAQVYHMEPCARTFRYDLELHLLNGYVYSTPDYFVMGRPVQRCAPRDAIVDPAINHAAPDCWHVYLAAGDMPKALTMVPYPLPWMSFERGNRLRFWKMSRISRRIIKLC